MTGGGEGSKTTEPSGSATAPTARSRHHVIWVDLLLYPTHSIPTAIAPVLVGVGLAIRDGVFAFWPALAGFLGSWVIHVAGVFTDNHELLRRHPAIVEHPELTEAVNDGTLRLGTLRLAIGGCLALAFATFPYLYSVGGAPVVLFGAVGIVASLSYHGAPFAYVRRGLADPIFFVMFGVVGVVGTYYIQLAATRGAPAPWDLLLGLPPSVFVAGLPAGAIVTAVMLIDDVRDVAFDAAKGWRNGAVRFGAQFVRDEITALVAFAYVVPFGLWLGLGLGPGTLVPLLSVPLAWRTASAVRARRERARLHPLTPAMARLAVVHSALLAAGLALFR